MYLGTQFVFGEYELSGGGADPRSDLNISAAHTIPNLISNAVKYEITEPFDLVVHQIHILFLFFFHEENHTLGLKSETRQNIN